MPRRPYFVLAVSLVLAGCSASSKGDASADDSHNPHYKQAQQDLDAGNPSAAATDYQAALAENPNLAEANYELGVLYADKLSDPISSIYHFKRYLELAPNSDKAPQVKAQIDKESQAFAATLPNASSGGGDIARLQADNDSLKKQLANATHTISQLQTQLARHHMHVAMQGAAMVTPVSGSGPLLADTAASNAPAAGTPADGTAATSPTPANVAPAAPPRAVAVDTNSPDVTAAPPTSSTNAAPSGPSRTYTIVKGDSLWKIAHKMYPGDTKNGVDKIEAANPGINPKNLKLGSQLIIPQ